MKQETELSSIMINFCDQEKKAPLIKMPYRFIEYRSDHTQKKYGNLRVDCIDNPCINWEDLEDILIAPELPQSQTKTTEKMCTNKGKICCSIPIFAIIGLITTLKLLIDKSTTPSFHFCSPYNETTTMTSNSCWSYSIENCKANSFNETTLFAPINDTDVQLLNTIQQNTQNNCGSNATLCITTQNCDNTMQTFNNTALRIMLNEKKAKEQRMQRSKNAIKRLPSKNFLKR